MTSNKSFFSLVREAREPKLFLPLALVFNLLAVASGYFSYWAHGEHLFAVRNVFGFISICSFVLGVTSLHMALFPLLLASAVMTGLGLIIVADVLRRDYVEGQWWYFVSIPCQIGVAACVLLGIVGCALLGDMLKEQEDSETS